MSDRLRLYSFVFACLAWSLFLITTVSRSFAWDYAINWTAAQGLRNGVSLYDGESLRNLGTQMIGPPMSNLFTQPFTSYIGLPTTAMFLLPFTLWPFPFSLLVYRVSVILAFIVGVVITGFAMPAKARPLAWIAGALCLFGWHAVAFSVELGQVDGWIVLFLAMSVLALRHKQWALAGIGIGLATLLKVSPGLLLLYCVFKRQWSIVGAALLTGSAGLLLSLLPQRGADFRTFAYEVLPSLGGGSIHVQNQALGAWLARLLAADPQFLDFSLPVGLWRYVGLGIVVLLTIVVWWLRRDDILEPSDVAIVLLLALLAGPITWDHYTSWAVISAMVLLPTLRGRRRALFVICLVVLAFPISYIPREAILAVPWMRILTGTQTIALLSMVTLVLGGGQTMRAAHDGELPTSAEQ